MLLTLSNKSGFSPENNIINGYFTGDNSASVIEDATNTINLKVGDEYQGKLPFDGSQRWVVVSAPVGMSIGINTGTINWCPTPDQQATYNVVFSNGTSERSLTFDVAENLAFTEDLSTSGWVSNTGTNQGDGEYNGTSFDYANSFKAFRTNHSEGDFFSKKRVIYLRGGSYPFVENEGALPPNIGFQNVEIFGTESDPVLIRPWKNERVKIRGTKAAIMRFKKADYITIEGLEVKGESDLTSYNEAIQSWWIGEDHLNSNGIAIAGKHTTVRDCVIHEVMGQGIAFKNASNMLVENCIVANSARWTTTGTTGIGYVDNISSTDAENVQSNILRGCLIYGVESRIYSRVFIKGYAHLTLDEGEGLLVQPSSTASTGNDFYSGRFLLENNCLMWCGKGIVINRAHKADVVRNTIYNVGTTITGTGKGLRGSAANDSTWDSNLVTTIVGSGGRQGAAISMGSTSADTWDTNADYSAGDLFEFTPADDTYSTLDGTILEAGKTYVLSYNVERLAVDSLTTFNNVECLLCNVEYIKEYFTNNYASTVDDDNKGFSGITYLDQVFANLDNNNPTPHESVPATVGADAAHHISLIEKGRSFSVNLTTDLYYETLDYEQMTKDIAETYLPEGLIVDFSNWKNTLPYTDDQGDEHTHFALPVTGDLATNGLPDPFELRIVHPYLRP